MFDKFYARFIYSGLLQSVELYYTVRIDGARLWAIFHCADFPRRPRQARNKFVTSRSTSRRLPRFTCHAEVTTKSA